MGMPERDPGVPPIFFRSLVSQYLVVLYEPSSRVDCQGFCKLQGWMIFPVIL